MSFEARFTAFVCILIASAITAISWHIGQDIHAIRETMEPKALTFGVEPPPFRARVDFRENAHQEPEVTLL